MWAAGEPRGGQYMNVNWIGPTLMRYGTEEQQARYIPPMARGETLWCQGFSEPESGSDLASLRTRAERHGDELPHQRPEDLDLLRRARRHLLPAGAHRRRARTGISIFLVPMDTPGITVRQIPSIIGEGDIHEVFFDDVEVPGQRAAGRGRAGLGDRAHGAVAGARRHSALRAGLAHAAARGGDAEEPSSALRRAHASRRRRRTRPARWRGCTATTSSTSAATGSRRAGSQRGARCHGQCERLVSEFVVEYCAGGAGRRRPDAAGPPPARHRRRHRLGRGRNPAQPDRHRIAAIAAGAALMDFTLTADQAAIAHRDREAGRALQRQADRVSRLRAGRR